MNAVFSRLPMTLLLPFVSVLDFMSDSVDMISLYSCFLRFERSHDKNNTITIPTIICKPIMKQTEPRNPIESYNAPLKDGPTNAPNANVEVHKPEMRPYVSILSGNPFLLQSR